MANETGGIFCDIDFEAPGRQVSSLRLDHSDDEPAYGIIPIPIATPTALLTAGNHSDEYEGQIIARPCRADFPPHEAETERYSGAEPAVARTRRCAVSTSFPISTGSSKRMRLPSIIASFIKCLMVSMIRASSAISRGYPSSASLLPTM